MDDVVGAVEEGRPLCGAEDVAALPGDRVRPVGRGGGGGDGEPVGAAGAAGTEVRDGRMGWDGMGRDERKGGRVGSCYLTDVTSQLRATAARQMREPRKPLPPKTTILFVADIVWL